LGDLKRQSILPTYPSGIIIT